MAHVLNLCCNVVQLFATVWMMSLIIPEGAGFVYYWWILLDGFRVFVHSLLRLAIMVLRDQLGFFIYVIRSAQLMLCIFGVLMVAVGFPLSTVFIFNQPSHATGDDEQNASADKFFEALKTNITIISSCFILTHCTSALLVLRAFKQFRARGGADSFTHQRMTNPTSGADVSV